MIMWPPSQTPEYLDEPGPFGYLPGPTDVSPSRRYGEEEEEGEEEEDPRGWIRDLETAEEGEYRDLPPHTPSPMDEAYWGEHPGTPMVPRRLRPEDTEEGRRQAREAWARQREEEEERKWERKLQKRKLKLTEAGMRHEQRKIKEDPWSRMERTAGRGAKAAGALYKIGTLGGPPKPMSKEKRSLYVPTAGKELYFGATEELKEATRIPMGDIRRSTRLPVGVSPRLPTRSESPIAGMVIPTIRGTINTRGQGVAMGLLRELNLPRGLTGVEKLALAEVVGNNDRDTIKNVLADLRSFCKRDSMACFPSLLGMP